MRKRVLFVHEQMNVGGVESALLAALRLLDKDRYDITLMLFMPGGALHGEIPAGVNVVLVPLKPPCRYRMEHGFWPGMFHAVTTGHWLYAAQALACQVAWRLYYRRRGLGFNHVEAGLIARMVDRRRLPCVDFAFAYTSGFLVGKMVARNFQHAVTGMWFHNENSVHIAAEYARFVRKFTHVYGCSQTMTELFGRVFAPHGIRVEHMPHAVDFERYRLLAKSGATFPPAKGLKILTVGRLCEQKGIDYSIKAARRLVADGLDEFVWYVLGNGADYRKLELQIREAGLGRHFVLLGETTNPFAYYRDCDIYAQPSRYEAYCLTVAEARAFAKPIVATDFVGAREQLIDGKTGIIVPVGDVEALAGAVGRLLCDRTLRQELARNLLSEGAQDVSRVAKAWEELLNGK